ncbi:MAG: FHA domain-containing protein [Planctomycetaceae bacterium]|nr:FHA domain-containing protein [Planctomycetaceae bacterium]
MSEHHIMLPFPTRIDQTSTLTHSRPELKRIGLLTTVTSPASIPQRIRPFRIQLPETIIGRDADSHLVLNDSSVSRKHARILVQNNEFYLEDLGSSNGTHVDDVPILFSVLKSGDLVQMGKLAFWFDVLLETRGMDSE